MWPLPLVCWSRKVAPISEIQIVSNEWHEQTIKNKNIPLCFWTNTLLKFKKKANRGLSTLYYLICLDNLIYIQVWHLLLWDFQSYMPWQSCLLYALAVLFSFPSIKSFCFQIFTEAKSQKPHFGQPNARGCQQQGKTQLFPYIHIWWSKLT